LTRVVFPAVSATSAWLGGILSAAAYLACFDTRHQFRWPRALAAIGLAAGVSFAYSQGTGEPTFVLGGVLGFVTYTILTLPTSLVGVVILSRWSRKLQKRVRRAPPGATVTIEPGAHVVAHLGIDKDLVLRAEGDCTLVALLENQVTLGIESDTPINVSLEGLQIRGGAAGIAVGGRARVRLTGSRLAGAAVGVFGRDDADITISECEITGSTQAGVMLTGATRATLIRNRIRDSAGCGVMLGTAADVNLAVFTGSVAGARNEVRENARGDLVPRPDKAWPAGFLTTGAANATAEETAPAIAALQALGYQVKDEEGRWAISATDKGSMYCYSYAELEAMAERIRSAEGGERERRRETRA
jgi:hypothetical protein